jgi:hypothetical protein
VYDYELTDAEKVSGTVLEGWEQNST